MAASLPPCRAYVKDRHTLLNSLSLISPSLSCSLQADTKPLPLPRTTLLLELHHRRPLSHSHPDKAGASSVVASSLVLCRFANRAAALAMPLLHVLSCSHGRPWELRGHAAGGQLGPT